jgi:L-fucose isomerase-like protein
MAKKASAKRTEPQGKPAKPQIPARLLAAVRTVLEDADDTGRKNAVVMGATSYNALRNVLHDLTGQWWGIEVEELEDEEVEEDEEIDDEEEELEDDDFI